MVNETFLHRILYVGAGLVIVVILVLAFLAAWYSRRLKALS